MTGTGTTNVRIARKIRTEHGVIIRTEVAAGYHVPPFGMEYIHKELAGFQAEEPELGWELECRGEENLWHVWGSQGEVSL